MPFKELHDLYTRKYTPKVKSNNSCKSCSLIDICLPKLCKKQSIKDYMNKYLKEE
jgi:CRISPR-associated exonuclease Cas4